MGISYLPNKQSWSEITRDERTFCAELFFEIRNLGANAFVEYLNKNTALELPLCGSWEIGFEVCFYRDYLKAKGKPIKSSIYPQKRTFDLCLFGESDVVIIEAKAQQGFTSKQNDEFAKDIELMEGLLEMEGHIHIIGLASSVYLKNLKSYGYALPELFERKVISWSSVGSWCDNDILMRADSIYNK